MSERAQKYNWFFESSVIPYKALEIKNGLKIKKKLYSGKSSYQKIEVFDTFSFGKILVLDGISQTSENDEFIYHEMLCHFPMFFYPNPKKVLIVGGGDGGALEEVLKYPIEKVWMVEIDKKVIEVSEKYLPSISKGAFKDKRLKLVIGDGTKFIQGYKNFFDVIILDLSDPWGPAKKLISLNFYKNIKKALRKNGMVSVQSGSITVQPELVATINKRLKKIFPSVQVHLACVPLYQAGEYSFTLASEFNLDKINLVEMKERFKRLPFKTKYYYPEFHQSSGILPKFLKELLN